MEVMEMLCPSLPSTRFGGNQVEALRNVNFTVEAGEYVEMCIRERTQVILSA